MNGREAHPPDARLTRVEQRALVALSLVQGVGTGRIRTLLSAFGSAQRVLRVPVHRLARVPGVGPRTAARIAAFDDDDAVDRQMGRASRVGAFMVPIWDARYPALLQEIYDPPAFLWVRGQLSVEREHERTVAVVGTRRPTDYGRRVARELAHLLARLGFTIVSGLAYGIDAVAHAAALEAGGRSIAVLGSGVDRIYPAGNGRMAHALLDNGALISEFPLGARPDASNFPRRNRVVSGLSKGTVVVEAYSDGGALITARLALEQNREVFAVPGPIQSEASAGTNALIQRGEAKLVQCVEDILEELGIAVSADDASPQVDLSTLAADERTLYRVLTSEPMHIDAVCAAAGLDTSTALVHLLGLEFKGVVRQLAGKQFYLASRVTS